jgi:hypothetical protein
MLLVASGGTCNTTTVTHEALFTTVGAAELRTTTRRCTGENSCTQRDAPHVIAVLRPYWLPMLRMTASGGAAVHVSTIILPCRLQDCTLLDFSKSTQTPWVR